MKKLVLPFLFATLLAAPAFAGEEPKTPSLQNDDVIQLGPDHERLCREAESLQENRIRDLRAAIEYDKKIEGDLLNGAKVREADAVTKENHAKQWRDFAAKNEKKRAAFNAFATWLETEARTDRNFATERRQAAGIIGKGWREAAGAIGGHERFLADLKSNCAT